MDAKCDDCKKTVTKFVVINGELICYECLKKRARLEIAALEGE